MPLPVLDAEPTYYTVAGQWNLDRTAIEMTIIMRGTVAGVPVFYPWVTNIGASETFDPDDAMHDSAKADAMTAAGYALS